MIPPAPASTGAASSRPASSASGAGESARHHSIRTEDRTDMTIRTGARSRRTAPPEERRQQLIDATMLSIAEHGISGTTMATVTGIAGLSAGIVSLHFQSKENLLVATLEFLAQEHRDGWVSVQQDETLAPAERLWAIMEAHFDPRVCTPTKIAVWFAFFGEARYRQVYRRLVGQVDTERVDAVEELCRMIAADEGSADVDPAALARSLESFADGLWLDLLTYPESTSRENAKALLRGMLERSFPAHFPPASASRDA